MSTEIKNLLNHKHIQGTLTAQRSPDDLSAEDQTIYLNKYMDSLWVASPSEEAYFAYRRKKGVGVGLDKNDNLVYQTPED